MKVESNYLGVYIICIYLVGMDKYGKGESNYLLRMAREEGRK